jgi:hypothetical protein
MSVLDGRIDHCPHCGRPFVHGYWRHVSECARHRQERLDREWERQHERPWYPGRVIPMTTGEG